jgi:ribosomal protein L37AE/L43A
MVYHRKYSADVIDRMIAESRIPPNSLPESVARQQRIEWKRSNGYTGPQCTCCGDPTRMAMSEWLCDNCGNSQLV